MSDLRRHLSILRKLQQNGSVPKSAASKALISALTCLLDTQVLEWERRAAGMALVVRDKSTFATYLRSAFPDDADTVDRTFPRSAGIAAFKDSKAFGGTYAEIVTLRAWKNGQVFRDEEEIDVVASTKAFGNFSFALDNTCAIRLAGEIALAENSDVFTGFERIDTSLSTVINTSGCFSNRFVGWLSRQNDLRKVVHFGDFDPIGLSEFVRLKRALGDRAQFYIPPNLTTLFETYEKRKLLKKVKSRQILGRLRDCPLPEVRIVVSLIDRFNAGLEHESLLL